MVEAAQTRVKRLDANDAADDDEEEENNNMVADMKEDCNDENLEDFQPKKDVKCRCIELMVENYELKELHRELIEDKDDSTKVSELKDKQIKAMQEQLKAMQEQFKAMEEQVKLLKEEVNLVKPKKKVHVVYSIDE